MTVFHFSWHKTFAYYILLSISLFVLCACGARTEQATNPDAMVDASVNNEVSIPDSSVNDSGCEIGKPFYGDRVQYFGDCSLSTMLIHPLKFLSRNYDKSWLCSVAAFMNGRSPSAA